ncbi:MAG: ImmA/IrrE family metallo-endopeptidase [Pyrinomonadaceae bacterium]
MKFLVEKASRLRINWNRRPLTEDDFHRLCKRFRITVQEMPLTVSGFYYCLKRRHFIAVDSKLPPAKKLFVMFHEFAHFLMHVPESGVTANFHGVGKKTRKEIEADAFALCALVPKTWIEARDERELIDDESLTGEMLHQRQKILQTYGF